MKKRMVLMGVCVFVVGAVACVCVWLGERRPQPVKAGGAGVMATTGNAHAGAAVTELVTATVPGTGEGRREIAADGKPGGLAAQETPRMIEAPKTEEQRVAAELDAFMDDNEDGKALVVARKLLHAKDAEIRADVLAALGWIGKRALPEMIEMLGDSDADIASDAFDQMMNTIRDIDDEDDRARMLAEALRLAQGEDAVVEIMIAVEDLEEVIAMRTIVGPACESANPLVSEPAREWFEATTGDDYAGPDSVTKWLQQQQEEEVRTPEAKNEAAK